MTPALQRPSCKFEDFWVSDNSKPVWATACMSLHKTRMVLFWGREVNRSNVFGYQYMEVDKCNLFLFEDFRIFRILSLNDSP